MAGQSTNIKIEPDLKRQAQQLFASLGMDMTTAINVFLRQAVREQAIPFRIGSPMPNELTRKAIEDARKGIGVSRAFSSVEELMEDLNAED